MSSSSSSSGAGRIFKGPQVFINFRGHELRRNFVDNLDDALKKAKINVFIDEDLEPGRKLLDLLVKIEESKVALAVISKEYTTSPWCLDELVKIKECMEKNTLTGIPIFYRVDPSVVGKLKGDFGDNFRELKHNNRHDLVQTQKWEEALTWMTEIKGMHLSPYSEKSDREFIELIVEKVKILLDNIPMEKTTDSSFICARKIKIEHSEKPVNWTWSSIQEGPNQAPIEIATLNEVYWFDIRGTYYTRKLIPGTKYKVVFVVKLEDTAAGWHVPVNLTLKISARHKEEIVQEQTSYLEDFINGEDGWVDIEVGDFVAPQKNAPASISFIMCQYDDTIKKTGLVVKGVAFHAMENNAEAEAN